MKNERSSTVLVKANTRLRGLKAINPALDFGNGRSVASLSLLTEKLESRLERHNELLKELEISKNELKDLENQTNDLSSKMLKGVEFMYGEDSSEYELAGGVRMSDRVRKSRISRLKASSEGQLPSSAKSV
jgi:predicted nuclease with TOPRIM domain